MASETMKPVTLAILLKVLPPALPVRLPPTTVMGIGESARVGIHNQRSTTNRQPTSTFSRAK